jgi:hypothetical protein
VIVEVAGAEHVATARFYVRSSHREVRLRALGCIGRFAVLRESGT